MHANTLAWDPACTIPGAEPCLYATLIGRGSAVGTPAGPCWSLATSGAELEAALSARPRFAELLRQHAPHVEPGRFMAPFGTSPSYGAPFVMLARTGDTPRAIVLGRGGRRRVSYRLGYARLRWLSMACLDVVYGGLVTDGSEEASRLVLERLAGLLERAEFDHVRINMLPRDHPVADRLRAQPRAVEQRARPHWVIDLVPGDFNATMSRHSARHLSNLRRLDRRLARRVSGNLHVHECRNPKDVSTMLEDVRDVASQTYQSQIGVGITHNPGLEARLRLEAEWGSLLCFVLRGAGRPIAFQLGFVRDGVYYCEGTGYDPAEARRRPGTVLFMRVMRHLCELGLHRIDFGFGDGDDKRLYGTGFHMESTIHLYAGGLRAALPRFIDRSIQGVIRSTQSTTLEQGVRRRWRDSLARLSGNSHNDH